MKLAEIRVLLLKKRLLKGLGLLSKIRLWLVFLPVRYGVSQDLHCPPPFKPPLTCLATQHLPSHYLLIGIGLAKYKLSTNLGFSLWITLLKLGVQPLIVLVLCQLIGLGPLETKATCLMACLPVGVNVYIMSQEFNVLQGATANALLITTTLACLTVPLTLAVFGLM